MLEQDFSDRVGAGDVEARTLRLKPTHLLIEACKQVLR
jgi:hypothetical protein